jgi:predicted RNA-binding Zn ribbon-like protein
MPAPFKLFGGHPALDLVNTLDNRFVEDGPDEGLESYADLLAFVRQAGLLDGPRIAALSVRQHSAAAAAALAAAHELREALAATFYGTRGKAFGPRHIKILERHFLEADRHRELAWRPASIRSGQPARATWTWGPLETDLELAVWVLAQSAASLLTSDAMAHVHMCRSETCRWLFLDSSKNHSRRWCDMRLCGNRMKARRHYARQQD